MELRQLEYFVAVTEEANFTRAAARVHIAQPGVSAQIRRLERELGQQLFDRSARSVRLTDAGRALLPYARAALDAVAGARIAVDELAGLVRGRLAVGVVSAGPAITFADMLATFHRDHPGVDITLSEGDSVALIEDVRSAELDLAVVGLGNDPIPELASQVLAEDPIAAAVGHTHPLASRSTVPLRELRDIPVITMPRGNGFRTRVEEACARAGFTLRIAFETSDIGVLVRLAAGGLGVAVLPQPLIAMHSDVLRAVPIRPAIRAQIALVWRASGPISPAARRFLAVARTR